MAEPAQRKIPLGFIRQRIKSTGNALSPKLLRFFEIAFCQSLKSVRIHCDAAADSYNRQFGSIAFARGEDVFFRRGAFVPESRAGLWLLAHELTHVLQQRGTIASSVTPPWSATFEQEANDAASAILAGNRVVVPIRQACPPVQFWGRDMHLLAVYWTGKMQGAAQRTAVRVALASQSLDDDESTAAPSMKVGSTTRQSLRILRPLFFSAILSGSTPQAPPSPPSNLQMRRANNSHALGVTYEQSEAVARAGIAQRNDLLFGLGMHPVGDYLAHANLSGYPTWGHQNGYNEVRLESWMWSHEADSTHFNPRKALDTIARFTRLWADFMTTPPQIPPAHVEALKQFVLLEDKDFEGKIRAMLKPFAKDPTTLADAEEMASLHRLSDANRRAFTSGTNSKHMTAAESTTADRTAEVIWLATENDKLFRAGAQDVSGAQNKWAALGQTYPALPPAPIPPPPDPPEPFLQ